MHATASRLLAAFVHPRTLDDYVELAIPLHSSREVRARVVAVVPETRDVATLVLRPNRLWRGHRAGQHVLLTAEIDGVRRARCFSVASAEDEDVVRITVKARPGGVVTPRIVAGALDGKIVSISQAAGDFVLRAYRRSGGSQELVAEGRFTLTE